MAGVRALWEPALVLDGRTWLALTALSVPAGLELIVPAAGLVAAVVVLARWRQEGAWIGLQLLGISGRSLLPAALTLGLLTGVATAGCTLVLGPEARRAAFHVVDDPLLRLGPWPGRTLTLGAVQVRPRRLVEESGGVWMEELLLVVGERVGSARRARIVRTADGAALELLDGVLIGPPGASWHLEWERWLWTLPPFEHRLELAQRSTPELRRTAVRTAAAGHDASYEWAVYLKRFLHPLAALLLPVAALPLGAARRPWLAAGLGGITYLVAVRLGDLLAPTLGPLAAALAGPAWVGLLGVVLWARWRAR